MKVRRWAGVFGALAQGHGDDETGWHTDMDKVDDMDILPIF
jgi:hypothetical protein